MNTYAIKFKESNWNNAAVYGITADSAADALLIGAKQLGFDTDPWTQTYTMALEAVLQSTVGLDTYTPATMSTLPKGDYFTLRVGSTVIYKKGDYCRYSKAYLCSKVTDMNVERAVKSTAIVYTGFTY
mgnify:CR=1 FL=1|tara:strand:- start:2167 stop:2550 length:384 start_codon:yes stop_codon:yes gene_type:complete